MSNIAFDQLLQITAPASPAPKVRPSGNEGDLFRSHLDRAADAADAKDSPRNEEPTSAKIDQDEEIQPETEQQDTSTNERDEVAPEESATHDDSAYATKTDEDETNSTDDTIEGDEVTLSAAAAAAIVETEDTPQRALETIEVSGSSSSSGQDSADQGTAQPAPESVPTSTSSQTPTETSQLDPTTISQDVSEEVPLQPAANESNKTAISQNSLPAKVAAAQETPTDTPLTETDHAPSANGRKDQPQATTSVTQAQTANASEQTLPENSADQGSSNSNSKQSGNPPVQQQQISDTTATIADSLAETKGTSTQIDTTTVTPPNANSSTANQGLAATARTPGVATATQAGDSGSDAARSTSSDTPTVDRVRFVRRVGGAIRSAQQRDGQIQLRLSPPELGTLKIQLTVNEGAITANLETETASARTVLLDNLPALRERLSEQGMTIEKFDVDVGREGQQQAQQQTADQREASRSNNSNTPQSKRSDQEQPSAAELSPAAVPTNPDDGLDIRI